MLQTLFYIPGELFGLPVFGFGLLLAVWAVAGAAWLAWLVRRQGWNADTRGHAQLLAVLGAAIAFLLPLLCDARGFPIRGYGMMMLLAVLSGIGLAAYRARRAGVDPEMIFALAFWLIVPGMLGARIAYVTEYWSDQYWPVYLESGPMALIFAIVNVAGGGLVVYGAFSAPCSGWGCSGGGIACRFLATADLIAPSMLLGLALGRVGCLLNGCCFGGPCDLPWKVTFPWNSPVHQHEVSHGTTGVLGLKFRDGPDHRTVIDSVAPDSPAAHAGLAAGMEVAEINGVKTSSAKQAAAVALGIDKLELRIRDSDGDVTFWSVDDPPEWQADGSGAVKIYGMKIAGGDDQEAVISDVRRQSPEAAAGIREGQRVESVSGREVGTIGQLRQLLDEHRRHPWLSIRPAEPGPADRIGRRSPLAAEPAGPSHAALQHDRRLDTLPAVALLRSFPPPRRRVDGLDDHRLSDHALPDRENPHRRSGDLGHRAAHFAEHQFGDPGRGGWPLDLCSAAAGDAGI